MLGSQSPSLGDVAARLLAHPAAIAARAHKRAMAATAAEAVVADLVELAPIRSDADLEDELCTRLGQRLHASEDGPLDDYLDPNDVAGACVVAATAAVRHVLVNSPIESEGWRVPWRVLAAVARILPSVWRAMIVEAVEKLHDLSGGRVLPETFDGPIVAGPVLWTRDVYGSRFGVTTAFTAPDGSDRWYLWDIDACTHESVVVHSAYYPTGAEALAWWQAGVGPVAAEDTELIPIDDPGLLAELLPHVELGFRSGGEDMDLYSEYHRSRRLAEQAILAVVPAPEPGPEHLNATKAATEFAAWLGEHRAGQPHPADHLEALTEELAESWCFGGPAGVYRACSPHRVAEVRCHVLNYYQDDFAADLVALLPDWVAWLAEVNGTPAELVERCRPYALGEHHPDVDDEQRFRPRVIE